MNGGWSNPSYYYSPTNVRNPAGQESPREIEKKTLAGQTSTPLLLYFVVFSIAITHFVAIMKSTFLSSVYAACVLATLLGSVSASPIPHPHPQLNANLNDVLVPRVGPEVDVRPSLVQSDLASRSDSFIDGDGDAMLFRRDVKEPKESSAQSPVVTDAATATSSGTNPHSGRPNSAGSLPLNSGPSEGPRSGGKGEENRQPQDSNPGNPYTGHDYGGTSWKGHQRQNFDGIVTVDGEPTRITAKHLTTDLHTGPGTTLTLNFDGGSPTVTSNVIQQGVTVHHFGGHGGPPLRGNSRFGDGGPPHANTQSVPSVTVGVNAGGSVNNFFGPGSYGNYRHPPVIVGMNQDGGTVVNHFGNAQTSTSSTTPHSDVDIHGQPFPDAKRTKFNFGGSGPSHISQIGSPPHARTRQSYKSPPHGYPLDTVIVGSNHLGGTVNTNVFPVTDSSRTIHGQTSDGASASGSQGPNTSRSHPAAGSATGPQVPPSPSGGSGGKHIPVIKSGDTQTFHFGDNADGVRIGKVEEGATVDNFFS
ncbi:hypothetical protein H0H93_015006 [Arthromyces matolae]|nr:hypothetical protein H0H93_015006 [Arthromyces matolae]